MELKERFDQYEQQPDATVWNKLSKSLGLHKRPLWPGVAAVATLAVVGVVALAAGPREDSTLALPQSETELAVVSTIASAEVVAMSPTEGKAVAQVAKEPAERILYTEEQSLQSALPQLQGETRQAAVNEVMGAKTDHEAEVSNQPQQPISTPLADVQDAPTVADVEPQPLSVPTDTARAKSVVHTKASESTSGDMLLWIPNAIAPNDDNEKVREFKVVPASPEKIESFEMYIYSRRGSQVFHTKNINEGWDGTFKGSELPVGTYVYIIKYTDVDKAQHSAKGVITLVK